MYSSSYSPNPRRPRKSRKKSKYIILLLLLLIAGGGYGAYKYLAPNSVERSVNQLQFDDTVTDTEKQLIRDAIKNQSNTLNDSVKVSVKTTFTPDQSAPIINAYVPVANKYAIHQEVAKVDLNRASVYVSGEIVGQQRSSLVEAIGLMKDTLTTLTKDTELKDNEVAFIPISQLSPAYKLLRFDGAYYLDTFTAGAVFRQVSFEGAAAAGLADLNLNNLPTTATTLKVNMTGVTALTRAMIVKLKAGLKPTYFSKLIGKFLADADITHVSNEVSFKTGCTVNDAVFCAPPEMIETLKDSGIDVVELTGNHNNDTGKQYNTESIDLYHSLKWHTFGGGLNSEEAAKPYIADQKNSKVTFLGYNYPDSPNGGPIAGPDTPGANSFDFDKIKADIASAKQSSFVIVDVQFWECYAYPEGYVEFPECDQPITDQKDVFRKIADLGADMVIGTQAHQPQTYELYKGTTPIYYGLGNLYFEQTQWPGTERGIILTHYFVDSKLVQTKLSPTVYDHALQTHLMDNTDAVKLLNRLKTARAAANL